MTEAEVAERQQAGEPKPSNSHLGKGVVTLCGRRLQVDRKYVPKAHLRGRTIHLCTEFCREAFLADPGAFFRAHSPRGKRQSRTCWDETTGRESS